MLGPSSYTRRGEQAFEAFQAADAVDQLPWQVRGDEIAYPREAEKLRQRGESLLRPTAPVTLSPGGEAISWDNKVGEAYPGETAMIINTLKEHPTTVAFGASGKRTAALRAVDVLEPALDAAESIQAANAFEKMLAHQVTAAHFMALRLLELAANPRLQPGEVARFTNAAARQMDVFQNGCLVVQKLKTKGAQRVIVQYQQVNVGPGGQALVAGKVRARMTRGRGRKKP